jgi:hypothetical protein
VQRVQYFFLRFYPTYKVQEHKINLRFWSIEKNRRFALLGFTYGEWVHPLVHLRDVNVGEPPVAHRVQLMVGMLAAHVLPFFAILLPVRTTISSPATAVESSGRPPTDVHGSYDVHEIHTVL